MFRWSCQALRNSHTKLWIALMTTVESIHKTQRLLEEHSVNPTRDCPSLFCSVGEGPTKVMTGVLAGGGMLLSAASSLSMKSLGLASAVRQVAGGGHLLVPRGESN